MSKTRLSVILVHQGGTAESVGIQVGDFLDQMGGVEIESGDLLDLAIKQNTSCSQLKFYRNGKPLEIIVPQGRLGIDVNPISYEGYFQAIERAKIPIVSVAILPPAAKYKLIDMISFQSTLGTGFFSEFGSDISNIFGTESNMMNKKVETSIDKCKQAMRTMAFQIGANAVIGTDFDFSTNSRDATMVAAQGTAVFIENIDEIFKSN
jgi:uncharacterized protein YbjQ (UPF0145 family)